MAIDVLKQACVLVRSVVKDASCLGGKKALVSLLLAPLALSWSVNQAWAQGNGQDNSSFFNPKAAADDVIVPMPCDGFMVFKKVYTSDKDKLHDKGFMAGSNQSDARISQAPNSRYIQGAFKDDEGYYYLIAKYELTEYQYKILSSYELGKGKCPSGKATIKDKFAKGNLSWFEAVELTRQYSHFLASKAASDSLKKLKNAQIPKGEANTIAFARLPTDSEWEYAARGGNKVTSSEFAADVFPLADGKTLADYAWYKGAESSANGKVNAIGLKEPNPVGLYDILGNVSEIILDPFYATRTGRLHGQSGGFVVRGGSASAPKTNITSAYRVERAYFTKGKESKNSDMGMRLTLSLPFTNSIKEVETLNKQVVALEMDDKTDAATLAELDKIINTQKIAQQKAEQAKLAAQKEAAKAKEEAKRLAEQAQKEVQKARELAKQQGNSSALEKQLQKELEHSKQEVAQAQQEAAKAQKERDEVGEYLLTMQQNLQSLRANMIEANAKKDEMRDRAIVSNLRLGGYLCSTIAREAISYERLLQRQNILKDVPLRACLEDESSNKCSKAKEEQELKFKQDQALSEQMVDYYVSYYADHITDTMHTFEFRFIKNQLKTAQLSLGKDQGTLSEYIAQFLKDVENHQDASGDLESNKTRWVKQCRALKR